MKIGVLAAMLAFAVGCDPGTFHPGPGGAGGSGGTTGSGGAGGGGSQSGTGGSGGNQAMPDAADNGTDGGATGAGAFGDVCVTGADCTSGVCFVGGIGSYCSIRCTTNADCTGLGLQTCNLQGYCKK